MIYTVTFNPSVDYVMRLEHFREGALNRAAQTEKYAGGKGINVSRVLNELNTDSTAFGFLGGFTGRFIKDELDKNKIKHEFIEVEGDTRINVKLKTGVESEINAGGPVITGEDFKALEDKLLQLNPDDHVIFAGSVPSGYDNAYERLAEKLYQNRTSFSIDAEGRQLKSALKYEPYLVKPNLVELEEVAQQSLTSDSEIAGAAERILEKGAKNILVTLGGGGAVFINKEYSFKIEPPAGLLVNSVGAGDSTVAGFVSRQDADIETQLKYAIAAGSATAFSHDLAVKEDIEKLLEDVVIKNL